jgi:hypothetical protein
VILDNYIGARLGERDGDKETQAIVGVSERTFSPTNTSVRMFDLQDAQEKHGSSWR